MSEQFEKQHWARQAEIDLRIQETRVREAQINLDQGYKKLLAEMEKEYAKLKFELEREKLKLEEARECLKHRKEDAERPFDL